MAFEVAETIRQRTVRSAREIGERIRHLEQAELDHLRDYIRRNDGYPPRGWNQSIRLEIDRLRQDGEYLANDAVTLVDRGSYLERLSFGGDELRKRLPCHPLSR